MNIYAVLYSFIGISIVLSIVCYLMWGQISSLMSELSKVRSTIDAGTKKVNDKLFELDIEKNLISSERDSIRKLMEIRVGDKALKVNHSLYWKDTRESFNVTYELDVLSVSSTQVKVKGYTFTTTNQRANEKSNFTGILDHVDEIWVNKKDIEPILTEDTVRSIKLDEILG